MHCKSYVAHYLRRVYPHRVHAQVVHFPPSSLVRQNFLNALSKTFHPSSSYNVAVFSEKVEILIRINDFSQFGHSVAPAMQYHINGIFEEKLKNDLYFIITSLRSARFDMTLKKAIEHYQELYGFTEETYPSDTIAQAYYRAKKTAENLLHNCHKTKTCSSLQLEI